MHYCTSIVIYISQQKHNRQESTNEQMQIMISNHRQQLDESRSEYVNLQNAYHHLENEFKIIVKGNIFLF
jgi:methylthioribose-1-phosphate isomerase